MEGIAAIGEFLSLLIITQLLVYSPLDQRPFLELRLSKALSGVVVGVKFIALLNIGDTIEVEGDRGRIP